MTWCNLFKLKNSPIGIVCRSKRSSYASLKAYSNIYVKNVRVIEPYKEYNIT
nr:MAG TPA: hypothetical protein [Bacteriophage sp.]